MSLPNTKAFSFHLININATYSAASGSANVYDADFFPEDAGSGGFIYTFSTSSPNGIALLRTAQAPHEPFQYESSTKRPKTSSDPSVAVLMRVLVFPRTTDGTVRCGLVSSANAVVHGFQIQRSANAFSIAPIISGNIPTSYSLVFPSNYMLDVEVRVQKGDPNLGTQDHFSLILRQVYKDSEGKLALHTSSTIHSSSTLNTSPANLYMGFVLATNNCPVNFDYFRIVHGDDLW